MQSDKRFKMARHGFSLLLNPFLFWAGARLARLAPKNYIILVKDLSRGKLKKIFLKKCLTLRFCSVIIISERRKERNKNMTRYHIYDREGNYVMTETNEAIAEQIAEELGGGYYEDNN